MKKGFTLVELLAIIIILGIIALITFPIVNNSIKNSKQVALERTIDSIEEAAHNYSIENDLEHSTEENMITLDELKNYGFLNKEIINPITNKEMIGCVLYKWDKINQQFIFNYEEKCDTNIPTDEPDIPSEITYDVTFSTNVSGVLSLTLTYVDGAVNTYTWDTSIDDAFVLNLAPGVYRLDAVHDISHSTTTISVYNNIDYYIDFIKK